MLSSAFAYLNRTILHCFASSRRRLHTLLGMPSFLMTVLTNSIYEIGKERINRAFVLNFGDEETANQKSYVRKLEEE